MVEMKVAFTDYNLSSFIIVACDDEGVKLLFKGIIGLKGYDKIERLMEEAYLELQKDWQDYEDGHLPGMG